MRLMTKTLEKRFAKIGSQENSKDPIIIAHYFNPTGAGDWYATEYNPVSRCIFGYASIFNDWCDEWGYTSLDELEEYKGPLGLGIERDLYWTERKASEVIRGFADLGE
jgi:hypothetical protein